MGKGGALSRAIQRIHFMRVKSMSIYIEGGANRRGKGGAKHDPQNPHRWGGGGGKNVINLTIPHLSPTQSLEGGGAYH